MGVAYWQEARTETRTEQDGELLYTNHNLSLCFSIILDPAQRPQWTRRIIIKKCVCAHARACVCVCVCSAGMHVCLCIQSLHMHIPHPLECLTHQTYILAVYLHDKLMVCCVVLASKWRGYQSSVGHLMCVGPYYLILFCSLCVPPPPTTSTGK